MEKVQEQYYEIYKAKAILEQIPANETSIISQLRVISQYESKFLSPLQNYLFLLGCYALNEELRVVAAQIAVKLQNCPTYTYLQLCASAGIRPQQMTTANANLAILCTGLDLKYPMASARAEKLQTVKTLGWEIDELVRLRNAGKANFRLCFAQTAAFEAQGFPRSLCAFVNCDLLGLTVLRDVVSDMSYDDGMVRNQLENTLRLLFLADHKQLYRRYVDNYIACTGFDGFVNGAWHCLAMLQQGVYADDYGCILQALLARVNAIEILPLADSFRVQQVIEEIFALQSTKLTRLLTKHASLDWVMRHFCSEFDVRLVICNICGDGRLHLLYQLLEQLRDREIALFDVFGAETKQLTALCQKASFQMMNKQVLTPIFAYFRGLVKKQTILVASYKDYKNAQISIDAKYSFRRTLNMLSAAAICLRITNLRPVNIIQYFNGELDNERQEFLQNLAIVNGVAQQFREKVRHIVKNEQNKSQEIPHQTYKSIKPIVKAIASTSDYLAARLFNCDTAESSSIKAVQDTFASDNELLCQIFNSGAEICQFARSVTPFDNEATVIQQFRLFSAEPELLVNGCRLFAAYQLNSKLLFELAYTQHQEIQGLNLQLAEHFGSIFNKSSGKTSADRLIKSFSVNIQPAIIEQLYTFLSKLDCQKHENQLTILQCFSSASVLEKYMRIPLRLHCFDRIKQNSADAFANDVMNQMVEDMSLEEKVAYISFKREKNVLKQIFQM